MACRRCAADMCRTFCAHAETCRKTDGLMSASMRAGRHLSSAARVSKLLGLSQSSESGKGLITAFSSSRFTNRPHCLTEQRRERKMESDGVTEESERGWGGDQVRGFVVNVFLYSMFTSEDNVCILSLWPRVGGSSERVKCFQSESVCVCWTWECVCTSCQAVSNRCSPHCHCVTWALVVKQRWVGRCWSSPW